MWQFPSEFEASSDQDIPFIKRQSVCELEGDASIDGLFDIKLYHFFFSISSSSCHVRIVLYLVFAEILNQQFKIYSSLSQTHSDVKMVQSLIPIWEVCFSHIYLLFFYVFVVNWYSLVVHLVNFCVLGRV